MKPSIRLVLVLALAGAALDAQAQTYRVIDLGTLGAPYSFGFAVNATGGVAGYSGDASGKQYAFLSGPNGGPLKNLGTLGGSYSYGNAVNDAGQVAGTSYLSGDAIRHAFVSGRMAER